MGGKHRQAFPLSFECQTRSQYPMLLLSSASTLAGVLSKEQQFCLENRAPASYSDEKFLRSWLAISILLPKPHCWSSDLVFRLHWTAKGVDPKVVISTHALTPIG